MKAVALFLAILATTCGAFGFSMYFPKFGTPRVFADQIVFAGVGWEPTEVICIDKKEGRLLWQISTKRKAATHQLGSELMISDGGKLMRCDLVTGRTTEILDTGFDQCSVRAVAEDLVLVRGERKLRPSLIAFGRNDFKKLWVAENVEKFEFGNGVVLCALSQRKGAGGGGYKFENSFVAAISATNATVLWKKPIKDPWIDLAVVGDYAVFENNGSIECAMVKDGKHLASALITTNEYVGIAMVTHGTNSYVWTREGRSPFSGHVIYSLSIPHLQRSIAMHPDWDAARAFLHENIIIGTTVGRTDAFNLTTGKNVWRGGQWNWEGVYDGHIYFSEMARDEQSVSVNSIEVKTGERKKLFERELAENRRPKFEKRLHDFYESQRK